MNTSGKGKHKIWLKKQKIGKQLVYTIGGGEEPHIGAISVCEPGKKPTTMRIEGHYDYVVTEPIAAAAAKKHGVKACCIGGVHVDNATKEDIRKLVSNCKKLAKKV